MATRGKKSMVNASVEMGFPENVDLSEYRALLVRDCEKIANNTVKNANRSLAFGDRTGRLRKSIHVEKVYEYTTRLGTTRFAKVLPVNREADEVHILVRAGGTKDVNHAHLVEFGHAMVKRDGTTVGYVPARAFLRPAFDKALQGRGLK